MGNSQSSSKSVKGASLACLPAARSACSSTSSVDEKALPPTDHQPLPQLPYTPSPSSSYNASYAQFLALYPEYRQTQPIDRLRAKDFTRLSKTGETYVDYMGGNLYPESLVRAHSDFLVQQVMGNTHSVSNSSAISSSHAAQARQAVLDFFDAPPGYTVIFTPNCSGALKLVGEAFPFCPGSSYILPADCHNSVNGIREFARRAGAEVVYLSCPAHGGIDVDEAKRVLTANAPRDGAHSLYLITGMSNITNTKIPLSLSALSSSLGYTTILDAAALAPTSRISLRSFTGIDGLAVSFYKMFGYPTGVGALVVKESVLQGWGRPWFSGGTVGLVQAPGEVVYMAEKGYERFEDGTINYLSLPAITNGLRYLSPYLSLVQQRVYPLFFWLAQELLNLKHENGTEVVRVLSRLPEAVPEMGKAGRWEQVGKQVGFTLSIIFLDEEGKMLPNAFIEHAAARRKISLRTGCVCNPGGATAILGIQREMALLQPGNSMADLERWAAREPGVVRVSLGLVTSFEDVWRVREFAREVGDGRGRRGLWEGWVRSGRGKAEGCEA